MIVGILRSKETRYNIFKKFFMWLLYSTFITRSDCNTTTKPMCKRGQTYRKSGGLTRGVKTVERDVKLNISTAKRWFHSCLLNRTQNQSRNKVFVVLLGFDTDIEFKFVRSRRQTLTRSGKTIMKIARLLRKTSIEYFFCSSPSFQTEVMFHTRYSLFLTDTHLTPLQCVLDGVGIRTLGVEEFILSLPQVGLHLYRQSYFT